MSPADAQENSHPDRARSAAVPANNRSAITNGSRLGIDLRTKSGRRWRDLYADALRRTNGRNEVLCRSLASLTVQHEALDAALSRGEPVDVDQLVKLSGAIGRVMVRAGIVTDDDDGPDATAEVIAHIRAATVAA